MCRTFFDAPLREKTLRRLLSAHFWPPSRHCRIILVNAVYHPQTFRHLPETVDYLSGLGLRQIFFNPDYSAGWTSRSKQKTYRGSISAMADRYIAWYLNQDPHFVSLIDTKIAVLIRGGYHPSERCQMGTGELAITPDGGLYPCERLIGSGTDGQHRIGSVEHGLDLSQPCLPVRPRRPA